MYEILRNHFFIQHREKQRKAEMNDILFVYSSLTSVPSVFSVFSVVKTKSVKPV